MGFEYIDEQATKLKVEYPGWDETINSLVKEFHERGERGEFHDRQDTLFEFIDAVRRACVPRRPYRSGKQTGRKY